MTQKTLSLPPNVFDRLKRLKQPDESYGNLIARLINEHEKKTIGTSIDLFANALDDDDSDDWGEIEKILYEKRRQVTKSDVLLDEDS